MLTGLQIENIAIIESASAEFSAGLNILTGETGSGKSILIDSINAVTGEKTSRELIRTGESSALVTAIFSDIGSAVIQKLNDCGIPAEPDGSLLIQRKIFKDGKNACRINGMTVTVSMLKSIGMSLINIHGQRDSQTLLDSEMHIGFVDSYAQNSDLLEDYSSSYKHLCEIKANINKLKMDDSAKARKTDLLNYQINEIERAGVQEGETASLMKRKAVLKNSEKLSFALSSALQSLLGDNSCSGASSLISGAAGSINSVLGISKELAPIAETLASVAESVDDAASVIDDVLSQLDSLDDNIDDIEQRLDTLYRLSKKYGETEADILEFLANARAELESITMSEEKLTQLNAEYDSMLLLTQQKAELLSQSRFKAGQELSLRIAEELKYLDMPYVTFVSEQTEIPLCETGKDSVQFLISANPGEEPKPLNKIASGGELSRIMLAMKNVLIDADNVGTLIFDEVDAGVSGSAAKKIAIKLASVSQKTQVLCITHLAQIAAYGDEHMYLYKEVIGNKTYTRIKSLSRKERAFELARITFGEAADNTQLLSSEQMIVAAEQQKQSIKNI